MSVNPVHLLNYSTNIAQPDIANTRFSITGSNSISAPVVINLTSDLTLTSANSLILSTSGYWVFNGNGHTITVDGVSNFKGLFSAINSGGVVENLSIVSANGSTLGVYAGAVAYDSDGLIDHAYSNFASQNYGGGIVGGMSASGVVSNSYSTGAISGVYAGGIVGAANYGIVHDSYSTGAITGAYSGGIAGIDNYGDINNVYSTGIISGAYSGGITGIAGGRPGQPDLPGDITNAYSTGAMTATVSSGGITAFDGYGLGRGGGTIANTYTTGSRADTYFEALIAHSDGGTVISSFGTDGSPWADSQASTYLTGVGSIWTDPSGTSTPYTLASNPGGYTVIGSVSSNNAWAGNTLQIRITDPTLNSGNGFFADQAALYGFGGLYGAPSQNLFNASYQWYADGVAINGATSATLTLSGAHLGKVITAHVSYTNGLGLVGTGYVETTSSATVNGVSDVAGNVSTYLDAIQAHHTTISNALLSTGQFSIYDGANTAVNATVAQLTSAVDAIALITSHSYLVGVADTAANLSAGIAAVISNGNVLSDLMITDNGMAQALSSEVSTLAALVGSYGVDLTSYAFDNAILVNKATDGTLYIKAGGSLYTCADGGITFFNGVFSNTDGIYSHASSIVPLFASSGGVGGYTLPDLFAGPVSLGLTYQLIETAQNAVVTGSSSSEFIKVANSSSIGKAVNGNGGNDVIDGGVGSTFVTGGANHNTTFFLDGRAPGDSWSTITDFINGVDKATIWGFVKGVSSIDTAFTNYNNEGAAGYTGLTLHFKNLLPDGQTSGSNANLNSITFTGHTLAELGATSLADLNNQINNGTNAHILVGSTQDSLGTHSYLYFH